MSEYKVIALHGRKKDSIKILGPRLERVVKRNAYVSIEKDNGKFKTVLYWTKGGQKGTFVKAWQSGKYYLDGNKLRKKLTFRVNNTSIYHFRYKMLVSGLPGEENKTDWKEFSARIRVPTMEKDFLSRNDAGKEYLEKISGRLELIGERLLEWAKTQNESLEGVVLHESQIKSMVEVSTDSDVDFGLMNLRGAEYILENYYNYKFLSEVENDYHLNCVINYMLSEARNARDNNRRNHLNESLLRTQFLKFGINIDKDTAVPIEVLVKVIEEYHSECCSLYICDGLMNVKVRMGCRKNHKKGLTYVFMANDGHCHPIYGNNKRLVTNLGENRGLHLDVPKNNRKHLVSDEELKDKLYEMSIGEFKSDHNLLFPLNDVTDLFFSTMKATLRRPFGMNMNPGTKQLTSFYHPTTNQQFVATDKDLFDRQKVCGELFKTHPSYDFQFRGQTWAMMGASLAKIFIGELYKSHYTPETQKCLIKFCTTPLVKCVNPPDFIDTTPETYDYHCCYIEAIMAMDDKDVIPMYEEFDLIEKYDGTVRMNAFYLVERHFLVDGSDLWDREQWLPGKYVRWLMEKGWLSNHQIKLQHVSSLWINAYILKNFARQVMELFPRTEEDIEKNKICSRPARSLLINWIGTLGRNQYPQVRSCLTEDEQEVKYLESEYGHVYDLEDINEDPKGGLTYYEKEGMYIVCHKTYQMKITDYAPIMRYIHAKGKQIVLQMIDRLYDPLTSTIQSVRTDSVTGWNLRPIDSLKFSKKEETKVMTRVSQYKRMRISTVLEAMDWKEVPDVHFKGETEGYINGELVSRGDVEELIQSFYDSGECLFLEGGAGNQKSTTFEELIRCAQRSEEKYYVLSSAYNAVSLLQKNVAIEENSKVLASFFHENQAERRALPDVLFVEEISLVSPSFYRNLCRLKEQGVRLIIAGEFIQTPSINTSCEFTLNGENSGRFYDMENKEYFKRLCDHNIMRKKFIEGVCRGTKELNDKVTEFKETGRLPSSLPISTEKERAVCFLKSTKRKYNERFVDNYRMIRGIKNVHEKGIFNSAIFPVLRKIDSNKMEIKNRKGEVVQTTFNEVEIAHCVNVHCVQGDRITEEYTLMDLDHPRMNRNMVYTMLTRATRLDHIFLEKHTTRVYKWKTEDPNPTLLKPTTAKVGWVYLMWKDDEEYVGMTITTIEDRMRTHNENVDNPVDRWGTDYQYKPLAMVYYTKLQQLKDVETRLIGESIQYSERTNVNKYKRGKAYVRTVLDLERPKEKEIVVKINKQKEGTGFKFASSVNKKVIKTRFTEKFYQRQLERHQKKIESMMNGKMYKTVLIN